MAISDQMVLVVEDDDSMRQAIARLLAAAGFDVVAHASAEQALADPTGAGATCVVSDLRLPAMSGLDLLTELHARGSHVPVILITAHDAPGLRDEVLRQGAATYLAKPFPGSDLLDAVRAAIAAARAS